MHWTLASREAVAALLDAVLAAHGQVDLLINNAGVAMAGNFEQVSERDFDLADGLSTSTAWCA